MGNRAVVTAGNDSGGAFAARTIPTRNSGNVFVGAVVAYKYHGPTKYMTIGLKNGAADEVEFGADRRFCARLDRRFRRRFFGARFDRLRFRAVPAILLGAAAMLLLFPLMAGSLWTLLLVTIVTLPAGATRTRLFSLVQTISKWSMADVFAVGMLIALLAAKGTTNLSAVAGIGFYCFASYCLVSNFAFQLLRIEP